MRQPSVFLAIGLGMIVAAFDFSEATAKTCTAPGHSSCTITCPDGCGVLYEEPNGPCHKFCSQAKEVKERRGSHSFTVEDLTLEEIEGMLKSETK